MLSIHYAIVFLQIYLIAFHVLGLDQKRNISLLNLGIIGSFGVFDIWRYNHFKDHIVEQYDLLFYLSFVIIVGIYATKSIQTSIIFIAIYFFNSFTSMVTLNLLSVGIEMEMRHYMLSIMGWLSGFILLIPLMTLVKVKQIKVYLYLIAKRDWLFFIVSVIIFDYYISNFVLVWNSHHQTPKWQVFGLVGVMEGIIGILGGLGYLVKNAESKLAKRKNLTQSAIISQQLKHYEEVRIREDETSQFRHDIRKQLVALKGAIDFGNMQEASEYLSNLLGQFQDIRERAGIETGSDSVNANLYDLMKKYPTVKCEWEGQIPQNLSITNQDIVALVVNLLENAFEATSQVNYQQYVQVKVSRFEDTLFFQVKNSHSGELKKIGEDFETTKRDQKNHGMGIQIVRGIVTRYHGEMLITPNVNEFMVEVTFLSGIFK